MKPQYLLAVFVVIFVSGCIQYSGQIAQLTNPQISKETIDLILQAETSSDDVKVGGSLNLYFLLEAKKNLYDISLDIFDPSVS